MFSKLQNEVDNSCHPVAADQWGLNITVSILGNLTVLISLLTPVQCINSTCISTLVLIFKLHLLNELR